jgi:hypothetical protein
MKNTNLLILTLAGLVFCHPAAARAGLSLQLVTTFDLSGPNYGPEVNSINEHKTVVGYAFTKDDSTKSFVRFWTKQVLPLNYPGAMATYAEGVNNVGTICGSYSDAIGAGHGWLRLPGGDYSSFDYPGGSSTVISGVNDAGDFVGNYTNASGTAEAFMDQAGVASTINVDGVRTYASGISSNGVVVGNYRQTSNSVYRGFLRMTDGSLVRNISVPGSVVPGISCRGVNKNGIVVGGYSTQFNGFGFLFKAPHTYVRYGVEGAQLTYLTGITDDGLVSGFYVDTQEIAHGLILRLVED